jgi:hypothetical protein
MAADEGAASVDFSGAAAARIMPWLEEERRVSLAADGLDGADPHLVQHWLDWAVVAPVVACTRADPPAMTAAPSPAMGAPRMDARAPPPKDPLDLLTPYLACAGAGPRRCGYIFNDGDISWHCRTCQVRHRPSTATASRLATRKCSASLGPACSSEQPTLPCPPGGRYVRHVPGLLQRLA